MKIGFFTANFSDKSLDEVIELAVKYGYEAVELPAFTNNRHLDIEEILKNNNASRLRQNLKNKGIMISALSNHMEGQLILGPYDADADDICKGSKEEKIRFGTERMIRTAQAANALEVPVVVGFIGCENFNRFFPSPYAKNWYKMEEDFVERWGAVLDKFREYGVKFAHEPHPNQLVYDIDTAVRSVGLMGNRPEWGFNFDPANLLYLGIDVENFIDILKERIYHVHAKDAEMVKHNFGKSGPMSRGSWGRLDRGYRLRVPGWGDLSWKNIITELSLIGYDYVISYEHEDATMSRMDGMEKAIRYLRPLVINAPYEGRNDILFK